jgi:hypothetical protein
VEEALQMETSEEFDLGPGDSNVESIYATGIGEKKKERKAKKKIH